MISVGSGNCVFLDPNQLHAESQANVTSTKTLNRYSHASPQGHEPITRAAVGFHCPRHFGRTPAGSGRDYFSERFHLIGMETVLSIGLPSSIAGSMRWPLTPLMQA